MDMALIDRVLTEIASWPQPLEEIVPIDYGELWLRDDWYDILKLIETKLPATKLVIPTNGSRLDFKALKMLLSIRTLTVVNFSLNAYFNESYETLVGLPAETMTKVRRVVERIRIERPGVTVWVSMVYNSLFMSEIEKDRFVDYWKGIAFPQVNQVTFCNSKEKLWRLVVFPCRSIFSDMVIGYDGKIGSCCFDPGFLIDLGTLDDSLLEIWQGPKFQEFRRLHNEYKRGEHPLCSQCSFA